MRAIGAARMCAVWAVVMIAAGCSGQGVGPTATIPAPTETARPTFTPTDMRTVATSATPGATSTAAGISVNCLAGWIVFASHVPHFQKDARNGIYKTCADGSSRQQIISTEMGIPVLTWPGGTKFLYGERISSQFVDLNGHYLGTFQIANTSEGSVGQLSPSPDGAYVFFLSMSIDYTETPIRFEVAHLSTGTISKDLVPLSYYKEVGINATTIVAAWSPKGNHIVWRLFNRLDVADIACDDTDHTCRLSNIRNLGIAPRAVGNTKFSWSPDGTRLVAPCRLTESQDELPRLCIFDLSGNLVEQYGKAEIDVGVVYNPSWSPDGNRIAFSDGDNLYVLSLLDKKVVNLTEKYKTSDDSPIWMP